LRIDFFLLAPLLLTVASAQSPQSSCAKAITFAVAEHGSLTYRLPNVSTKWFDKAQKKFPNVCFLQYGSSGTSTEQYLIVLSTQSSAFSGLYPVYRTTKDTSTSPTTGNGTITDNRGSSWSYTYQGTTTSTTTTTQQTTLPYTDTTLSLFANVYDKNGNPLGSAYRSESFRQGGDSANTLGYNLGGRLSSIHIKERLLDEIVSKVSAVPNSEVSSRPVIESHSLAVQASGQSSAGDYEELWTHAAIGMHNIQTFAASKNVTLPPIDDVASRGIVKCIIDAKSPECSDNWPLGQKAFAWMLELGAAIREAKGSGDSLLETVSEDLTPVWSNIRDVYCRQSPGATYTGIENRLELCPSNLTQ
jgi:hypothetical protein